MQLGMIGLGRMGGNMVRRLMKAGHQCVVFDHNPEAVKELAGEGATGATSLTEFVTHLTKPRAAWVMVPAGEPTESTVKDLAAIMEPGDTIIDGGNSYYKDDIRRARTLKAKGIHYVDVGTSGGVWGLERGYCMMIGGPKEAVNRLDPIFKTLAPGVGDIPRTPGRPANKGTAEEGYLHCGPSGRRPLRQDGPQRHRVRPDAGVRRGLRHLQERQLGGAARGAAVRRSTSPRSPRSGAAAAWSARGCST